MTVTVIVSLQAHDGKGDELAAALQGLYPALSTSDGGLLTIDQYRVDGEPDRIVEIETWEQPGQHAAWSEQAMADGVFNPIFPFLAAAPDITVLEHSAAM